MGQSSWVSVYYFKEGSGRVPLTSASSSTEFSGIKQYKIPRSRTGTRDLLRCHHMYQIPGGNLSTWTSILMVALHVGRPHVLLSGIYQLSDAGGQACYAYNLCVQVNRYKYSLTVLCNPQLLTNLNAYK